jgi:hypothetical protein
MKNTAFVSVCSCVLGKTEGWGQASAIVFIAQVGRTPNIRFHARGVTEATLVQPGPVGSLGKRGFHSRCNLSQTLPHFRETRMSAPRSTLQCARGDGVIPHDIWRAGVRRWDMLLVLVSQ